MEWVETTGRTVEAALDVALDTLGVDNDEVEFEVLEEPRTGLLGRRPARIRARVRPISREKPTERHRRPRRSRTGGETRSTNRGESRSRSNARSVATTPRDGQRRRRGGSRPRSGGGGGSDEANEANREEAVSEVSVQEQASEAEVFTRGLVDAFGAPATVATTIDEEGGVLVDVTGENLGLLVGPRGATLQAIEELVRTVVQRRTEGRGTRINVDVGGYRAKRRAALARFAEELADKVRESGQGQALEPMPAADRKVVHDAIAELDGVDTISEGEEPHRRVVVRPA
jgi:spoIIIJ-associated protein